MKILFINHNLSGEGTFFRGFHFAKNLVKLGHETTLLTVSQDHLFRVKKYVKEGVKIIESPKFLDQHRGGWAPLDVLYKIAHTIKNKYDIIHGIDHKPNVYFPLLAGKVFHRKDTIFFSDWADWWTKGGISSASRITPEIIIETFLEENVRKWVDGLTVTSITLKERALNIGIKKEKIFYIPSGCDIDHIKYIPEKKVKHLRKKLKLPLNSYIIEFIGFGQGDVDILIHTFNLLKQKYKIKKDIYFLIVGPADKRIENLISHSLYRKNIITTGRVKYEKISDYAGCADIFLMPLRDNLANRGRGPIKMGDYMAAGRAIIGNPVGDVGYFIKKYKIGMLCEFNAEDFAEKISYLLKNNNLRKKLGENALYTAQNILSWYKVTKKLETAYKKIKKIKNKNF